MSASAELSLASDGLDDPAAPSRIVHGAKAGTGAVDARDRGSSRRRGAWPMAAAVRDCRPIPASGASKPAAPIHTLVSERMMLDMLEAPSMFSGNGVSMARRN
jgi:hypothetical protein